MPPRYLRVSVTGRCNLRCRYCRPEGPCDTDLAEEFTPEEISTLVQGAAAEGVCKVRLTGGEPLLRNDLEEIVSAVSAVPGIAKTTLTTNGIGLAQRAETLRDSGLDSVNVSLDTLRPERFTAITRRDMHPDVIAGIEAACDVFDVVKLNCVLMRGVNDDEIEALVGFAARGGGWIRFIERYQSRCVALTDHCVPASEVKERLRESFGPMEAVPVEELSVEETYVLPSAGVKVGLIASVTHPPCERCTKLRFTASGELRPCLFADWGIDVGPLLRLGDLGALRAAIRDVFTRKRRSRPEGSSVVPDAISHIGG